MATTAITVASPLLKILPGLQNGVLGAGLGLRCQTGTGTISSSNTYTEAVLGLGDLQLSEPTAADPTTAGLLGMLWTPKHITCKITNTSGQTITGIDLQLSDADATAATADPAPYDYGQAADFPTGGIASGGSALVTYTILGPVRRYPLLTLTFGAAPTTGSATVTVDLSGEGSAKSVLSGSLVPQLGWNKYLGTYSVAFAANVAAGTVETVAVPIPTDVQKDALYLVSVNNPSALGTSVTVTFNNGVNFGGSTPDYSEVTSVDVASAAIKSYLIQGWLLGDADAQISASNDAAASSSGGTVQFEVTMI